MNGYSDCKAKAEFIFNKFVELRGKDNNFKHTFFVEYPDVDQFNIQNPILVLGLNPAGGDDNRNQRKFPNLLTYVPQIHETIKDFPADVNSNAELLTYKPYFKTFFQSFQALNPTFNPIWYNSEVLEEIFNNHNIKLFNKPMKEYLRHFGRYDNRNYVIFADIIQFQRTNSKDIIPHLSDELLMPLIDDYIITLISFIKPKLVLVANAAVSHYFIKRFNKDEETDNLDILGTKIFLASMLTGQRSMDVFSRIRLFKEIQSYIS